MEKPVKRSLDYYLLWSLALISLALNVFTINALLSARRQAGAAATSVVKSIEAVKGSRFEYVVKIDKDILFATNVPINFTVQVPISQTVPINTTVNVPLKTPLGTFPVDIPISTRVPINLTVDVPIKQTVPVSATVPVKMDVPIVINLASTPFGAGLDELKTMLKNLAKEMGQ